MRPNWKSLPTVVCRLVSISADVATLAYVIAHVIG
jgi:hypothetical protein